MAGEGLLARAFRRVVIEGRSRGSVAPAERIEVTRYDDTTLYDRLYARGQLNQRQHRAAARLGRLWTAAGLNPRIQASYAVVSDDEAWQEDEAVGGSDLDGMTARDRYRKLMRRAKPQHALRLESMLLGDRHPGIFGLATLQEGLDWLCDEWGIKEIV